MKRNRSVWCLSLSLCLLLPGCGGGSMGTGVKTLGRKPIDDSPTLPNVTRLFSGVTSCSLPTQHEAQGFSVDTEFGGARTEESPSGGCTFLIPMQSQRISIYSSWLEPMSRVYSDDGETYRVDDGSIELRKLNWKGSEQRELVLRTESGDHVRLTFRKVK